MADLQTTYMGIALKNPVVVGACSLSKQLDTIRQIEAAGAGALVIKSLFEEQVQLERAEMEAELSRHDELYAEAVSLFPKIEHGGATEHVFWIKKTRKAVSLPLFASLNAVRDGTWVDWARQLEDTGVDGLELNFYSLPLDPSLAGAEIEKRELDTFSCVREAVKLPLAVKLHPFYTSLMNVAAELDRRGANAIVLFNRLFQPDIDIQAQAESSSLVLSEPRDGSVALRWTALLHGRIKADLVTGGGILSGQDAIKMILAGAQAVQVVSALYRHSISHIGEMLEQISAWMDAKGHARLQDFLGRVSKKNVKDPWGFERGQYIKALLGFD